MNGYVVTFTARDTGEEWTQTYTTFADAHDAMAWWTGDCDRGQSEMQRTDGQSLADEWYAHIAAEATCT